MTCLLVDSCCRRPRLALRLTGVETFVFMAGVAQAEPKSLPIPGIVGVIIGLIVGVFLFRGAKPANLAIFFYISTFMLFLIAGGLFSRGMHEFQEMGKFGKYWSDDAAAQGGGGRRHLLAVTGGSAASGLALPYPAPAHHHRALMGGDPAPAADTGEESVLETVEGAMTSDFFQADAVPVPVSWANTPLADWRECCDDGEHEFYILLRAIFGYSVRRGRCCRSRIGHSARHSSAPKLCAAGTPCGMCYP